MRLSEFLPKAAPSEQCQRLFHGRGHCYPGYEGITLDYLPPALLLTQFQSITAQQRQELIEDIQQWWQQHSTESLSLVWQDRSVSPAQSELFGAELPQPHWAQESNLWFELNLLKGQNHGLFLDMANGRQWLKDNASGKKVLNLFAYTCGFSVFACDGGATEVVNLDMSKPALAQGKRNHQRNGFDRAVRYLGHDLFKTFGKLTKLGPFDLVVVDPPSFQQGSFIATKDYPRLLRRLPSLMSEGAEALLCLNAPELSQQYLMAQVAEHAPQLQFVERLANPTTFKEIDSDRGLKVLRYRRQ